VTLTSVYHSRTLTVPSYRLRLTNALPGTDNELMARISYNTSQHFCHEVSFTSFSFFVAPHDLGLLIIYVLRSLLDTPTRYDSPGRVIGPSQRSLPDNTQYSQATDIHDTGAIRTRNPIKREAADPRFRPRGHWDRRFVSNKDYFTQVLIIHSSRSSRAGACNITEGARQLPL